MVLELDCGNSLIKWRVLARDGSVLAVGAVESIDSLRGALQGISEVRAARMVSVRGDEETAALCRGVTEIVGSEVLLARPASCLAGVQNGYRDYSQLGMDRWLALVAAWNRARTAVLVIDLGTAVTIDLVDEHGQHLGGYIGPGLALMRKSLLAHTSRIRYQTDESELGALLPGRSTREAVEHGCRGMLQSFVATQLGNAAQVLGVDCRVFVTGGDAELALVVAPQAEHIADLVFAGLALACPLTMEEGCD